MLRNRENSSIKDDEDNHYGIANLQSSQVSVLISELYFSKIHKEILWKNSLLVIKLEMERLVGRLLQWSNRMKVKI